VKLRREFLQKQTKITKSDRVFEDSFVPLVSFSSNPFRAFRAFGGSKVWIIYF